ncbi:MAG: hypothetical protein UR98_C0008G0004 [Parcubacteria group bacterium GW2011_GWA1_36_12]|nr:MAG: hypothetical protein UR98_C0008G0004 [Parcubacteria group bacterium GW2011_GWA1_36_12]
MGVLIHLERRQKMPNLLDGIRSRVADGKDKKDPSLIGSAVNSACYVLSPGDCEDVLVDAMIALVEIGHDDMAYSYIEHISHTTKNEVLLRVIEKLVYLERPDTARRFLAEMRPNSSQYVAVQELLVA